MLFLGACSEGVTPYQQVAEIHICNSKRENRSPMTADIQAVVMIPTRNKAEFTYILNACFPHFHLYLCTDSLKLNTQPHGFPSPMGSTADRPITELGHLMPTERDELRQLWPQVLTRITTYTNEPLACSFSHRWNSLTLVIHTVLFIINNLLFRFVILISHRQVHWLSFLHG